MSENGRGYSNENETRPCDRLGLLEEFRGVGFDFLHFSRSRASATSTDEKEQMITFQLNFHLLMSPLYFFKYTSMGNESPTMKRYECVRVQRRSLIRPRARRTLTIICNWSMDHDPQVDFGANFLGGSVDLSPLKIIRMGGKSVWASLVYKTMGNPRKNHFNKTQSNTSVYSYAWSILFFVSTSIYSTPVAQTHRHDLGQWNLTDSYSFLVMRNSPIGELTRELSELSNAFWAHF